jgi:hypothetical protein
MKITSVLWLTILCIGCGYSSPKKTAPQPGVVPKLRQLSPDNAKAGGLGFTLTVNASSFGTNAVVNWNGTGAATTFVTSNQLAAAIPATAIATPATVPVSVPTRHARLGSVWRRRYNEANLEHDELYGRVKWRNHTNFFSGLSTM